jgi:hypothetical protein
MATKAQMDAAVDAVLLAAEKHGKIAEAYITRPIATEVAQAVIAAYEAFADPLSKTGQA